MTSGFPVAAGDTHCCVSSVIRGSLVCASCLAHHPFSPPQLGSSDVWFFNSLYCCTTILPLLTKQGCPRGFTAFSLPPSPWDSFGFLAQGCHLFLASWAVTHFLGLLYSFAYGNRNLGRKALQACAHVAMVTCKRTVPSEAFLPSLPMFMNVRM